MIGPWRSQSLLLPLVLAPVTQAIDLSVQSIPTIEAAASYAAWGMMTWYAGNETGQTPGVLRDTWWEAGAMFMALMEYYHFTGDATYNDEIIVGMEWQAGNDGDYMSQNQSGYIGNDDQMFWGLAAMTAAELGFPEDPNGFSWLSLAEGVFNSQVPRWDASSCGGGLRWQIWTWNPGYDLKNSISNGGLFQLSARLARYTHNETYADWANKIWNWATSTPLIDTETWEIGDSVSTDNNCTVVDSERYSYNYGTFLSGAAYMYNYTNGSSEWLNVVNNLVNTTFDTFAPATYNNILTEACEPTEACDRNDILFKGLTAGWMAFVSLIVPSTYNQILTQLQTSAQGAAGACTGAGNDTCGVKWYTSTWDNEIGLEEQMSALNIFWSILISRDNASAYAPTTAFTGGTSNTSTGSGGGSDNPSGGSTSTISHISTADRAGAGILTAVFAMLVMGAVYWMVATT